MSRQKLLISRAMTRVASSVDAKGIYMVSVAARLLHEKPSTIHRWAFGYRRRGTDYTAAISTDVAPVANTRVLTFVELVELMFIQGLLKSGLTWPKVRDASQVAARLLGNEPHPFASRQWFVDPAALYLKLGEEHGEPILIEVAGHGQFAMEKVLAPYLKQLDFDVGGVAQRWYPRGLTIPVIVDPRRSFGMPVTAKAGVPTETLAALHRGRDSISSIAAWYRMDEVEVQAAVEFEQSLSRAA
ncbi:MAG: hypothetical protein ABR543_01800 [Gemmatimonadaceae bacterium]